MWITKVTFVGSDGNKTINMDISTTKHWAENKYERELERWFKILTPIDLKSFYPIYEDSQALNEFKLELIDVCLNVLKKKNNSDCSFKIEMYESFEDL